MQINRRDLQTVEMQMGPMIDMVFLLLVFFMVTAKPIKPEADVGFSLPGTVSQEESVDIPDEQRVDILADGQIVLNELKVDSVNDHELPTLLATLIRFKKAADAAKSDPLVTINPDNACTHRRITDVLNACAKAGITGVTVSDSSEEGES
jgi:biopolymer transport protein ExbD